MLSTNVLLHGRDTPPATKILLRAGRLSMIFEPQTAFLRYIRFEGREVLRGIYVAVRDEFWNTVAPRVTNLKLDQTGDSFRLTSQVECIEGPIDFLWQGEVTGNASGAITYDMKGVARSMFRHNRIGFCVLHPASCAGRPCVVRKTDGSAEHGQFPEAISPHQPFFDIRSISHEFFDGRWAEIHFEGDVFEMEDQRNWTDASFKTYCTPLSRPHPVELAAGTTLSQRVTMRLKGKTRPPAISSAPGVSIGQEEPPIRLPRIGLGIASHDRPLSEREADLLRALGLDHLRVDLNLSEAGFAQRLERAAAQARALNTSLEIALFFGDAPEADLERLCDSLRTIRPSVVRWLLFRRNHSGVSDPVLELARRRLTPFAPDARFGTGTDIYFTELNRERPAAIGADFVCFSVNPQVHAFDDDSLMETLEGQTAAAHSARRLYPNHSLVISPITLRPRFNPNGTKDTAPGRLPPQVDPRQMSLFAAAWTLGTIGRLAASGAESLTYYETTGWRGVIETDDGSRSHAEFASVSGAVFPVYHLLADLAELRDSDVRMRNQTEPLTQELAFTVGGRNATLLANLTAEVEHVSIKSEQEGATHRVRLLDATTAFAAMTDPGSFRSSPGELLAASALQLDRKSVE
jgi:hypothetical protein